MRIDRVSSRVTRPGSTATTTRPGPAGIGRDQRSEGRVQDAGVEEVDRGKDQAVEEEGDRCAGRADATGAGAWSATARSQPPIANISTRGRSAVAGRPQLGIAIGADRPDGRISSRELLVVAPARSGALRSVPPAANRQV